MVLFTVALFAMAGLVIDGGAALAARGRAADLAQQASRAGADALSPASVHGTSPAALRIDPAAARAAADRVLSLAGASGQVQVSGLTVVVTARVPRTSVILSAFGVSDLTGVAAASATILHSTTGVVP
jgi:Flp pilus assembly protein TadG